MSTMKVGQELVSLDDPCAMANALRKVRIRLSAGQLRETVRIDGEEVTFQRARLDDLKALITEYETACRRKTGGGRRTRFAKTIRWT
ncbi:hypothetical protein [Palleronia caenipelagi]|uniref:Uncharacterized protein n=1 Tax=Palleronia caenipelagi TaxID=2489174 RepID=A0A547PS45_9RHOB|nr:hypothetical protein [Palleronia caenipelagi]TRD16955.1 hypothetical protein FEV53_13545 [Palleronia caenipelagi]